ncbi:MAG: hypothetical protein ACREOQ_07535 [Gemmatimonadales bacterium]
MGDALVHDQAVVQCDHLGPARPMTTNLRVKVSGQKVVTRDATYTITGCGLSASGSTPCATAQWTSAASRVKAGGVAVVLTSSKATCTPTGASLQIVTTQTRVTGT